MGVVATTTGIANGQDTDFRYVGRFNDSAGGLLGGGVVVGTHQILTARHVVNASNFGSVSFELDGTAYHPTAVALPPNYLLPDGSTTKVDVALITVQETFSNYYGIGSAPATGSSVTMVGFGQSGHVSGDFYTLTEPAGLRRKGDNTVDSSAYPVDGIGPTLISYLHRPGDASLADRDSGGGWFQDGKLIGISSFIFNDTDPVSGDADPAKYGNFGFAAANIDGYDSNVDSPNYTGTPYTIDPGQAYFGSGAVDLTDPHVNAWLQSQAVPEPASMVALGLGAAALLRRRRR